MFGARADMCASFLISRAERKDIGEETGEGYNFKEKNNVLTIPENLKIELGSVDNFLFAFSSNQHNSTLLNYINGYIKFKKAFR